jgi:hypothetical protein
MVLHREVTETLSDEEVARIQGTVREITKLLSEAKLFAPGGLCNDGIVIEDIRNYE